jgi:hypothetical protein
MIEWWTARDAALLGAFGGAGAGIVGGCYGALIGWLAPKGIGGKVFIPVHIGMVVIGVVSLVCGLVAVFTRQPYHVYYPLLLGGSILTFVMGGLLPVVIMRYRQAEARKMDAQLLRKG